MSVATASTAPGAAAVAEVPRGERGATRVADRVVAKIAAAAAREALRAAAEGARTGAHATVTVRRRDGRLPFGEAHVHVTVELGHPTPIGARCGAVRRQVTARVRELAGMDVSEVAVEVERLHSPLERDRERVR
ncbi:Asp23/Gls24 family envelope stress response protein [Streptomyces benahoarensis]|uniref:Asp23/Gls24 family envelope stress response protein n=1 Tax=Streptomyces benahoarensis TaxID=2595054 RepID=A0A553XVX6_9ACTN|nr:Asp23/Gls24 family envelope stress response protein [Streptomyces benahoarensis]TSB13090.1 Asp23/Gls24 family envelope stress response protein [Streptomyces benahoarensis]TSB21105.1 Asp23/Gls24 family envelope stress response protein [Streptomyces benahoarensis]